MAATMIEHNGETRPLREWAAIAGMDYRVLWSRLKIGTPIARALDPLPLEKRKPPRNPEKTLAKECLNCGASFVIPKCSDWREHCCSGECKVAHRKAQSALLAASRTKQCIGCGRAFVAKKSQLDGGHAKYCSNKCSVPARNASRTADTYRKISESQKRAIAEGRFVPKSGPRHMQWTGGKDAARERQRQRARTPELRAMRRAYLAANRHKQREWATKRRGLKVGRLPRGTIQRIGRAQRWKCAVCTVDIKRTYHVDHVMPLAKGGEHAPHNLQLLCPSCNVRKSAKHPIDFMQSRGFLL